MTKITEGDLPFTGTNTNVIITKKKFYLFIYLHFKRINKNKVIDISLIYILNEIIIRFNTDKVIWHLLDYQYKNNRFIKLLRVT